MGLYNDVKFRGGGDLLVRCTAGHVLRDLQSKEIESPSAEFVIYDGRLYGDVVHEPETEALVEGAIVRMQRSRLRPKSYTGSARVYAHCFGCMVLYHDRLMGLGDEVAEREPWVEVVLLFEEGRLVEIVPYCIETRDDVREALASRGLRLLGDDEPLAILHRRELAKQRIASGYAPAGWTPPLGESR